MSTITEIAPDVYRISVFVPAFNMQFNQFLVRDEEPVLVHTSLPPFDADTIAAKFAILQGVSLTAAQANAWHMVKAFAEQFAAAKTYLFSVPMWNFGIPYVLKHYIDVVTLPGITWQWSQETGYQGLLRGKRAVVIYASAGDYRPHTENVSRDFQKPYMRTWLRFMGVRTIREITVAPTVAEAGMVSAITVQAKDSAQKTVRTLWHDAGEAA